jgi:ABC-type transporter Mla subunit MlaD
MGDENGDQARIERERRRRNVALALALGAMVVLFFVLTLVRLKGHVIDFTQ